MFDPLAARLKAETAIHEELRLRRPSEAVLCAARNLIERAESGVCGTFSESSEPREAETPSDDRHSDDRHSDDRPPPASFHGWPEIRVSARSNDEWLIKQIWGNEYANTNKN